MLKVACNFIYTGFLAVFFSVFVIGNTLASNLGNQPTVVRGTFSGAMETEYPAWFHDGFLDFKDDLDSANREGKRLMIMFTQDGCPYCNAMVERNLAQRDIEERVRKHFSVIAINLVGDRALTYIDGKSYSEKTFAEALKVQFTPTILFLNEKGETILRLNGYLPPDKFKIAIDFLIEKSGQLSYRDYLELNAQPAQTGKLNKQKFFLSPPYYLARNSLTRNKPLAVFFEQKDCPNCDILHQQILPDAETIKLIGSFDAVQVDMWDQSSITTPEGRVSTVRDWARQLDVKYAPTIILFSGEGKEIIRAETFFKKFHTQSLFDYVQSGSYLQQPNFQRYLSKRSEHGA